MRYFYEVKHEEIEEALRAFLDRLDISGSDSGVYDLYGAIDKEYDKSVETENKAKKVEEKLD